MKECSKSLSETVIGCAIEVHRTLGAGLLEKPMRNAWRMS